MKNGKIAQRLTNAPNTICAEAPTLPPYDPRRGDPHATQTHTLALPARNVTHTHPIVPRLDTHRPARTVTARNVNREWGAVVMLV